MKKVKYLLGFLVLGLGLLFNQSFGLDVELVDSDTHSQYLLQFPYRVFNYYNSYSKGAYMFYSIGYNYGSQVFSLIPYYLPSNCGSSNCQSFVFNNSVFEYSGYNSSSYSYNSSTHRPRNTSSTPNNSSSTSFNFNPSVVLQGTTAFACIDCFNSTLDSNPKFKIGGDFIVGDDYKLVSSVDSSYFRFYNEWNTGFDINSINLISGSGFPFDDWEFFMPLQVRTNYGRIATPGYSFGRIGSPEGMGFSIVYSYDTQNAVSGYVSYNNLQFRTYYDTVIVPLKLMLANQQTILIDSDLSGFYFDGVLVLPDNSYHSGESLGSYILAKDPTNIQRILYELYSCNRNEYPYGSGFSSCIKLDAGYLTFDGSQNVLPFTNGSELFSIDYSPEFYPLLTDLTKERIYTNNTGGGFIINDHIYGFDSDPSVDIVSILNGDTSSIGGDNISSYSSWYYSCLGPSYNTPDGRPPAFCLDPEGNLINFNDYKDCFFDSSVESGQFYSHFFCEVGGIIQELDWVSNGSGGVFIPCSGDSCGSLMEIGPNYLSANSSFTLTTGLIEDMFTNITGWVGRCPYPYTDFQLGKNSPFLKYLKSLGFKFDPFVLVNCIVAGFNYGRHTIDTQMFGDTFEHPLIYGITEKHRLLCSFFDFIVILGFIGFIAVIKKLF